MKHKKFPNKIEQREQQLIRIPNIQIRLECISFMVRTGSKNYQLNLNLNSRSYSSTTKNFLVEYKICQISTNKYQHSQVGFWKEWKDLYWHWNIVL